MSDNVPVGQAPSIARHQLNGLQRGILVAWGQIPAAAVIGYVLNSVIPTQIIVIWVLAAFLVVLFRTAVALRAARPGLAEREVRILLYLFAMGAGASGAVWGSMALYFIGHDNFAMHIFLGAAIAGMVAAGLAPFGWFLPAYTAYLLCAVVPLAVSSFFAAMNDSAHYAMGVCAVAYVIVLYFTARLHNRSILRALTLLDEANAMSARLQAAQEQSRIANDIKWRTLAHVGHELRTPMNAVLGYSEVMAKNMLGPLGHAKYSEYADNIHRSGRHVLDLIADILDLSQIEAGKLSLKRTVADIRTLIVQAVDIVAEPARQKGLAITTDVPESGLSFAADALKLRQVLINLLSNAVKFTPAGGSISVSAAFDGTSGALVIAVEDTGIGMSEAEIPLSLTPFVRLDNAMTRQSEGSGLGLALCQRLVELHGGTLEIASETGRFTRVTVRLPRVEIPAEAVPLNPAGRGTGEGILRTQAR